MAKSDAVWIEVDVDSLGVDERAAFDGYKDSYRTTKTKRIAFEELMNETYKADGLVPDGHRLVFGYNFGKLSVAVVEDTVKPKAKSQPKQSLADYLAARSQVGLAN